MPERYNNCQNDPKFRLVDFIPIFGIIPNLRRNRNIDPQNISNKSLERTLIYCFYQGTVPFLLAYKSLEYFLIN